MVRNAPVCLSRPAMVLPVILYVLVSTLAAGQSLRAEVTRALKHDVSRPLRDITPIPPSTGERKERPPLPIPVPPQAKIADPVLQTQPSGSLAAPTSGAGFDGVGEPAYNVNVAPPDTNGSVGETQYIQWVNLAFGIFDKATGAMQYGPAAGNTIWSGFGGVCETRNDGDPIVLWDKVAKVWIFSQLAISGGFYQCVAVSQTADATGLYNRYVFQYPYLNDYPKIGVWSDAYYATFNMFRQIGLTYKFQGSRVCAWDRAAMLAGTSATQQCFQLSSSYGGLLPSDFDGSAPAAGKPNFMLAFGSNSLLLWKFHVDWVNSANTTLSGPTTIPVAAFSAACSGGGTCIPQSGTSQKLDSLADRLMYRLAYRDLGDHDALVVNHSVTAGSSVGVRWYEVRSPGGAPTVYQQGTYAPDSSYRWMGSIAMDKMGNIAMGYSVSSSSMKPAIRYTGRMAGDTLGTMQTEAPLYSGAGSQLPNLSRWGDYSSLSVDPVDDCSFWYTTEYLKQDGTFNWSTRVASFSFSNCSGGSVLPPAPTGLTATPGDSQVSLAWDAATGASSYNLYRSTTSGGEGTVPYRTGILTNSYNDSSLINGSTYYYQVTQVNSGVESTKSNEAFATPSGTPPPSCSSFSLNTSQSLLLLTRNSSANSVITVIWTSDPHCTLNFTVSVSTSLKGVSASVNPTSSSTTTQLTVSAGGKPQSSTGTVTVTASDPSKSNNSASVPVTVNVN